MKNKHFVFFCYKFFCKSATNHGHIFWIQDGSIRSDINLQESITIDLDFLKTDRSNEQSTNTFENGRIFPSDFFVILYFILDQIKIFTGSDSNISINPDKLSEIPSLKPTKTSEKSVLYLDLFTSDKISPYFIVSFREYLLVVNIIYFLNIHLFNLDSLLQLSMNHSFK